MGVGVCGGCPNVLRMHAESGRARAFFARGGGAKFWVRPPSRPLGNSAKWRRISARLVVDLRPNVAGAPQNHMARAEKYEAPGRPSGHFRTVFPFSCPLHAPVTLPERSQNLTRTLTFQTIMPQGRGTCVYVPPFGNVPITASRHDFLALRAVYPLLLSLRHPQGISATPLSLRHTPSHALLRWLKRAF